MNLPSRWSLHAVSAMLMLLPAIAAATPPVAEAPSSKASRAGLPTAPAPYALPWQLRPAAAASVVRSDSALAFFHDDEDRSGQTLVTLLQACYQLGPFAPIVRLGWASNWPPKGNSGNALLNPVVGSTYLLRPSPAVRLAFFLAVALPVGQGGGNDPNPAKANALKAGILARSAMDNALFAVNDLTVFPGVDLAWVKYGFTVQAEATLLQLTRVRGAEVQKDKSRTNFTSGVFVGYFVLPQLSLGGEVRMQRWFSTPAAVKKDSTLRDQFSFAVGPRLHLQLDKSVWLRPGIAYARGLDKPMTRAGYNILQLDIPLYF